MDFFVISHITLSAHKWNDLFARVLDYCDEFSIVFPDGEPDDENPLLNGKSDFWILDNVRVEKWTGMKEASMLSGSLTANVRELFVKYMGNMEEGDKGLWHFALLANKKEFLTVEDFTVCTIDNVKEHLEYLKSQGVNIEELYDWEH